MSKKFDRQVMLGLIEKIDDAFVTYESLGLKEQTKDYTDGVVFGVEAALRAIDNPESSAIGTVEDPALEGRNPNPSDEDSGEFWAGAFIGSVVVAQLLHKESDNRGEQNV